MGSQDRPTLTPQDLSGDWSLRGASRVNHGGVSCPALGGWAILRRIGQGGMGVVYYGINPRLGTEVAVKLLPRDVQERNSAMVERFLQEARLAARLRSPHLVGVLDVDRDPGTGCYFLVMEYVHGVSAGRWLDGFNSRSPPGAPEERALDVAIAATRGLVVAHQAGIVHRDVKPDNVLIPFDGRGLPDLTHARLADLGLARTDEAPTNLTESFVAMGTLGYAAPEQLQDVRAAQKQADVFSMAATLYALLAGRAPFARAQQVERLVATLAVDYTPIRDVRPDVSRGTSDLLAASLRKEPSQRPADGAALLEQLLRCRVEVAAGPASSGMETRPLRTGEQYVPPVSAQSPPPAAGAPRRSPSQPAPPADATLYLESEPAGADVRIDGVVVGVTPLAARALSPGRHEIVLEAPDHTPSAFPVVAKPGEEIRLGRVAMLRFGEIDLSEWPQDVVLESDGRIVGHGTHLPPGRHAFRAVRPGCLAARVEVELPPGVRYRPPAPALRRDPIRIADDVETWDAADDAERESAATAVAGIEPGWRFLRLETFACGGVTRSVAILLHERTGSEFSLVPGGRRKRGSPAEEPGRRADEVRFACTAGPALVARTPVTVATWERLAAGAAAGARPASETSAAGTRKLPVHAVSWSEAQDFCLRAGLRLPTETEWEWAARGGVAGRWCFGDDESSLDRHAWSSRNSGLRPRPVGTLAPNAFGLHDVHGNVAEWCEDEYREDPREPAATGEGAATAGPPDAHAAPGAPGAHGAHGAHAPAAPARYRVFRGGSFRDGPDRLRCAARGAFRPDWRGAGVRPVRAVEAGLVDLSLVPSDAEVEVEGRVVTGSYVHLAPGPHVLTVRRPDTDPVSVPVSVAPRQASAPVLPAWPSGRGAATAAVLRDVGAWEGASSEARENAARDVARRLPGFAFAGTRWFDCGGRRFEIAILRHEATGIEMSLVPGGRFEMGSPTGDPWRAPTEPQRSETVGPFLLARTPVTQAAWTAAMGANPATHRGPDLPVEQISWLDAQEFCRRTGLAAPTEVQWEFACRAGTATRFSFGDDDADLPRHAWYESNAGECSHPVGALLPNSFGLHDMHGNVWEWCADAWADYDARRTEQEGGAVREESQIRRVVRGGAWTTTPAFLRCAARLAFPAGTHMATIGFRPSIAVPESAPGRTGTKSDAGAPR